VGGLAALTSASAASAATKSSTSSPNFIPLAQKGAPSGVAALNAAGALFTTQAAEGSLVTFAVLTPFTAGVAPFTLVQGSGEFGTTYDQTAFLGWNAGVAAGGGVSGQPSWHLGWENNYYVAGGYGGNVGITNVMEWYLQYGSSDASAHLRPIMIDVDRTTASSSGATIMFDIGTAATGMSIFYLLSGPSVKMFQMTATQATFFVNTHVVGGLVLDSSSTGTAYLEWEDNGSPTWWFYAPGGGSIIYFRDMTNSRMHVTFTPGATATAAITEINSSLKVDGNAGFFGKTPVVAQVSGGTTAGAIAGLVALGLFSS
jgi:hypothetical protein